MQGAESVDFLQRISTNDALPLNSGKQVQTILVNEKGRIVDLVNAVRGGVDTLLLLGNNSTPMVLTSWLEKFIIMEDIRVCDESHEYVELLLLYVNENLDLPSRVETHSLTANYLTSGNVLRVVCRKEKCGEVIEALKAQGHSEQNIEFYDSFRVFHQIPAFPAELSDDVNPLEAGLKGLISWTKGCYVGQEVIARLDTYRKVQRILVGFRLSEMPKRLPAKLIHAGVDAGIVTSASIGPDHGDVLALGYVKLSFLREPIFTLEGSNSVRITATLIKSGAS